MVADLILTAAAILYVAGIIWTLWITARKN